MPAKWTYPGLECINSISFNYATHCSSIYCFLLICQLFAIQALRKEYALARSLAISQAQVLRAHDEIKMATSRLRLRENENDKSIDALSPEELDTASVENSSEKFIAMASLSRIKGQLRYLKVNNNTSILGSIFSCLFPCLGSYVNVTTILSWICDN